MLIVDQLKQILSGGDFVKNTITLMTGTTIAQAIPILAAPVLTRLYSPQDFGIFALFMSVASVLSVMANGRYQMAIMLPDKERDAANIVELCIVVALLVGIASMILFLVLGDGILHSLDSASISPWLLLVPLLVFMTGAYQGLNYWSNRHRQFKRLAISRVVLAASTAFASLIMGFLSFGPTGLVLGALLGQSIAVCILMCLVWHGERVFFCDLAVRPLLTQARRYHKFPLYSLPADIINSLTNQAPTFILNAFFGASTAGLFNLTQRVLGGPVSLIAGSMLDVFKEHASRDFRTKGSCRDIYVKTLKGLILLSVIPCIFFALWAPTLFAVIFGEDWREAGEYARILSVMYFWRFISSPLGYVLYISEKQNYDLVWQVGLLVFTILSLSVGVILHSAKVGMLLYAVSYSAMYVIYLILSFRLSQGTKVFDPSRGPAKMGYVCER